MIIHTYIHMYISICLPQLVFSLGDSVNDVIFTLTSYSQVAIRVKADACVFLGRFNFSA